MILFADDTNVFFSDDDLTRLTKIINSEMEKLSDWFLANRCLLILRNRSTSSLVQDREGGSLIYCLKSTIIN